uniref:Endonuclease/exonuclease/phosphatase domain-containing protein n=1 Tax=Octopus bimaculoides TaxID=37653 RepID=A0A0L8HSA2_OCTBM
MGDFNARIERNKRIWKRVNRNHEVGKIRGNDSIKHLSLCAEHGFLITSTIFKQTRYANICATYELSRMVPV